MSDQQPQEQAPKRRAGNIKRYTTLRSSRTRERSNVDTSGSTDSQTPEVPGVDTSESPGVSTPERIDTEAPRSAHVQEEKHPDVQASTRRDTQEEKRSGTRTPSKRERHTIYFPPDLSEWVKIRAIKTKREISEVVTEAVERYRQQEEENN
ncbi:MAG TPA: hypothetical protein VHV10_01240 [Ktedonobacteraceae bacterium]|nr:hypothetical protein [Ktedonobacteraceae bacterium]